MTPHLCAQGIAPMTPHLCAQGIAPLCRALDITLHPCATIRREDCITPRAVMATGCTPPHVAEPMCGCYQGLALCLANVCGLAPKPLGVATTIITKCCMQPPVPSRVLLLPHHLGCHAALASSPALSYSQGHHMRLPMHEGAKSSWTKGLTDPRLFITS
uniref:Uncharacterized protein n=1 Tax=Vitis vinifera TaxID=29760 RepID=A5AV25_VITVI|nr:hypothetical protein VITISV_022221 [Vitis vinifera]